MNREQVKVGGMQCAIVRFISSDDKPLVGIQLYHENGEPAAWLAMTIEQARMALIDLEETVARASSVKRQ